MKTSSLIEFVKRALLKELCDELEVKYACKDHTTCLRMALQRAGVPTPKKLQ